MTSTPYPIAMIPFTNVAPYRQMGAPDGCEFVDMYPRNSIDALLEGRVWAAIAPVGGMEALRETVDYLGQYGIAARTKSRSVLLFSKIPFQEFDQNRRVCLTGQSASSVRLFFLLAGYQNGFKSLPKTRGEGAEADGALIIGDQALKRLIDREAGQAAEDEHAFPFVTDLATEWNNHWKIPFVFARWVVRKDAPLEIRKALNDWLRKFAKHEETLLAPAAQKAAERTGFDKTEINKYFKVLTRVLTEEFIKGQERFESELREHASQFPKFE